MKLYSRSQVIFFSFLAAALVMFLLIGFGLVRLPGEEKEPSVEAAAAVPVFEYQTNHIADSKIIQVSDYEKYTDEELNNIKIYESLNEGVVNISTETLGINFFLEPVPMEGGTGSGSIIDKRGYVLTNFHVVENAYKVFVTLYDGSHYEGEVIGRDQENDLAIVKFDPDGKNLVTVPFGDSSGLRVGQKVIAIGNPYGYDRTMTTGIVSGLGRPVRNQKGIVIQGMIQTDASINPGNSGGPLIDSRGSMIGINTVIYSPSGGSVGIGFAVPVDSAKRVVPELIEYGTVKRGWIDIVPIQLDRNIVRYAKLPVDKGLLISQVKKGGFADSAGLSGGDSDRPVRYGRDTIFLGGDIIVEIDGFRTESIADMFTALEDNRPGEVVEVVVVRGRSRKTIQVKLSDRADGTSW